MVIIRFGVWTLGLVPIQRLRSDFVATVGTFVLFGPQTDIHTVAQDRQVSQLDPPSVAVGFRDLASTVLTNGANLCTFNGDDLVTSFVLLYF